MFNNVAKRHNDSQLLNPFSDVDGRRSPRPQFSKDEYGKPVAGSLTEFRGQKANLHVYREMMELCDVINSSGAPQSISDTQIPTPPRSIVDFTTQTVYENIPKDIRPPPPTPPRKS
uniref:Uncharacterized protein n=1 Tax=Phlebotomus papatasi TaxID=29031 RepID=A0A1B0GQH1_PHLPP